MQALKYMVMNSITYVGGGVLAMYMYKSFNYKVSERMAAVIGNILKSL